MHLTEDSEKSGDRWDASLTSSIVMPSLPSFCWAGIHASKSEIAPALWTVICDGDWAPFSMSSYMYNTVTSLPCLALTPLWEGIISAPEGTDFTSRLVGRRKHVRTFGKLALSINFDISDNFDDKSYMQSLLCRDLTLLTRGVEMLEDLHETRSWSLK